MARPVNSPFTSEAEVLHKRRRVTVRGEAHGMAKLTEGNVITIKAMLASGERGDQIAALFKVSEATISNIAKGKKWAHIKGNKHG